MSEWAAKRFWRDVTVDEVEDGFGVGLDGRRMMTPGKHTLVLPTRALAEAVAREWDEVDEIIEPLSMPWTRSANSAVEKVAPQIEAVARHLAEYAATDLVSYRAERPSELVHRQQEEWDPLIDWAAQTFGGRLAVTTGVMPVEQGEDVIAALAHGAAHLEAFGLTAFHEFVTLTGSYVIGLHTLHHPDRAGEMWRASRIDHDWQAEQWGRDEEAEAEALAKQSDFLHAVEFLKASSDAA